MGVCRLALAGFFGLFVSIASAAPCTSTTLSPSSTTVVGSAANYTLTVTAASPSGCTWAASSNSPWITISFGTSGVVGGTVGYTVTKNPSVSSRTGSITVSGTTFTVTQEGSACTTTLSSTSATTTASGGTGSFTVYVASGCTWTARSNDSWITIVSGSGSGNGTVTYSVAQNTTSSIRYGSIDVGTATFYITQSGFSCSYTLSPSSASYDLSGGSGSFTVTASSSCSWTASTTANWIVITSGLSGSGSGTVSYTVYANSTTSSRTGTITVGGTSFTITQSASCTITLNPVSKSVSSTASTGTIQVTTNLTSCAWSAYSDSSWLTISSGSSDTGSGTISYSVAANTTATSRTGHIIVGTATFTITQVAAYCSISVSPNPITFTYGGGQSQVTVTSTCAWSASTSESWIRIASTSGTSGNGTVTIETAINNGSSYRDGTVIVGGVTVVVRQLGTSESVVCSYTLSRSAATIEAAGGTGSVAVTTDDGCTWTATTADGWITITSGTPGNGSGEVRYSVAANSTSSSRTGTITIGGQAFSVYQAGTACSWMLSPKSATFTAAAGSGSILVAANCAWNAIASQAWITISSGSSGSGDGTIAYAVAQNTSGQARSGTIGVMGQTFSLTQAGASCTVSFSKTSANLPATGGSGSFTVTGTAGCTWEPASDASWLTLSFASSNGSGTVYFTAPANTSGSARVARIVVQGETFILTQDYGPAIAAGGVVNAASFQQTSLSPGLIVTFFGTGMGPATLATLELTADQSALTTALAGTRVLFDDTPAPMIYTSATQVSAIVPYSVAGKSSTKVAVEYNGVKSGAVEMAVAGTAPAIFTISASGSGQGAILNQDYSVNSTASPARRGEIIQIFATGEGVTNPVVTDGLLVPATSLAHPIAAVSVKIGDLDASVEYAGSAPGLVAGLLQVNAKIPSNARAGDAVPLTLTIGDAQSQPGVTVVVR